jgi:exonuclease VII large subunit
VSTSNTPPSQPATKADLEALEQRLLQQFERQFGRQREYIDERARDMQTELLRGFRSYQESMTVKVAKLTADVSNIDTATDKRIAIVEERLSELERRIAQRPN